MLLGVVSVLAVATVVIGLPVWLLVRQRAPAPKVAKGVQAPGETGEWVFPNPAQVSTAQTAATATTLVAPAPIDITAASPMQEVDPLTNEQI